MIQNNTVYKEGENLVSIFVETYHQTQENCDEKLENNYSKAAQKITKLSEEKVMERIDYKIVETSAKQYRNIKVLTKKTSEKVKKEF